ncbi:hypothetical protein [Streptomyces sp. IBSBF 2806]|uniref:hypothetical protein n=1 Tax=Streptomyces sp. IBSBF 2806 TaxID=2903529 RepID=UPI002FDBF9D3
MKLHIADTEGTLLARHVEAAPTTAFGLLAREACARRIARFFPVTNRTGGPRPHKVSIEQWLGVIQRVADQGCEARACCFARADRRPRPEEIVPVGVIQVLGPGVCGLAFGSEGHAACSRRTGVGGSCGAPHPAGSMAFHRALCAPAGAAGAHRTAGFPFGLPPPAARLLLVLPFTGCVRGLPTGVVGFPAGVADRPQKRPGVGAAEAPEDRPGRAALLDLLLHAGDHDGERAVVHVEAVVVGVLRQCGLVSSASSVSCTMTRSGSRGPTRSVASRTMSTMVTSRWRMLPARTVTAGGELSGGLHLLCGVWANRVENENHRGESVTDTGAGRGATLPRSVVSIAQAGDHR